MANKKISDFTPIVAADIADGDLIPIVDVDAADAVKNKITTVTELLDKLIPPQGTYTPVFQGIGNVDVADTQYVYTLHNGIMTIWGEHFNGSPTAAEVQIGLPMGYKIDTAIVNPIYLGLFQRNSLTSTQYAVIATGGDIFLNVSRLDTGTGAFTAMLGNAGLGTNEKQSFFASFPVELDV